MWKFVEISDEEADCLLLVLFGLFRTSRQAFAVVSCVRFAQVDLLGVVRVALVAALLRGDASPAVVLKKKQTAPFKDGGGPELWNHAGRRSLLGILTGI